MYSLCDRNKYLHYEIDAFAEVYNHFIALHKRYYRRFGKYPSKFTMINHLAKLKRTTRFAHWRLLPSQALQNVVERIDFGYQKFFARDNKRPPTFRSRFRYQSYTLKQAGYKFLERNKVRIGKRIFRYHKSRKFDVESICTVTIKRDRVWLPSSKTCSACDTVKENLELRERTFHCCACGLEMDRDLNAAINIHRWGRPPMAEVA